MLFKKRNTAEYWAWFMENNYVMRRFYAKVNGKFWLPCPLCDRDFGGNEWLEDLGELRSTIPNSPNGGTGICPVCTLEGKGYGYGEGPIYERLS